MSKAIGTVKWFDNAKGYGFLINQADEDVFVHYRSIVGEGFKTLKEGQQVEFVQKESERGWSAEEVSVITDSHPVEDNSESYTAV